MLWIYTLRGTHSSSHFRSSGEYSGIERRLIISAMVTDFARAVELAGSAPTPSRPYPLHLASRNRRQTAAFVFTSVQYSGLLWARKACKPLTSVSPRYSMTRCATGHPRRSLTRLMALPAVALASILMLGFPHPAFSVDSGIPRPAVTAVVAKHESIGHRIAASLKRRGIPDEAVVFTVSALPVVELRGGIPLGYMFGMNPCKVFALAVAGNMFPVFGILAFLRLSVVRHMAGPFLTRARKLANSLGDSQSVATALALFVGVPLPGTGAFTGTFIAFVLDMPTKTAILSVGAGVVMAACIMTLLSSLGKLGAVLAIIAMLVGGGVSIARRSRPGTLRTLDIGIAADENYEHSVPASLPE
jgi:uncharacterized membrane protein